MAKPRIVSVVLWMVFASLLSLPVTAEEVKKSPSLLVEMSVSPTRIDWAPAVEAQRWVLTLKGSNEFFLRREIEAGRALFLSIFDSEEDRLSDGSYTWELKAVSKNSTSPRKQSGSFSVQDGSFAVTPRGIGESVLKPPLASTIAEDSVVTGGITIDSSQPYIIFDDHPFPEIGMYSSHDWALITNMNDVDQFSLIDWTNDLVPFNVAAGAPDNSLHIAASGNVGLGTPSPSARLDIRANAAGDAAIRVQNSSATGFSGFEAIDENNTPSLFMGTDNANNYTRINSLNSFPLVILTNSTERMRVTSAGNVGIGTSSPGSKLVVVHNAASETAQIFNTSSTGYPGISYFDETFTNGLYFGLDNAANTTRMNSVNNNPIVILTNSTERIRFPAPGGNVITAVNGAFLSAGGVWTNASSRESKRDITEISGLDALKALQGLNPVTFRYKEEPDEQYAGFIAEDLPDLVATNDHKHLSSMDVIAVLTRVVQDQQKAIDEMSARLADLEGKNK